jgi:hypothetical protein
MARHRVSLVMLPRFEAGSDDRSRSPFGIVKRRPGRAIPVGLELLGHQCPRDDEIEPTKRIRINVPLSRQRPSG